MAKKAAKQTEATDAANGQYFERQAAADLNFKSPFAMLNATAQDCQQQRIEIGMSDADLERDKATFNRVVDDQIKQHGYPDTNEKVDAFLELAFEFVTSAMRDKRYPQSHWPLVACHAALVTLQAAQNKKTFKVDAAMTNVALFAQGMMNIAWRPTRMREVERIARSSLAIANDAASKKKARLNNLETGRAKVIAARIDAAKEARDLCVNTLFPDWKGHNPTAPKIEGFRHCADVLTQRGYVTANKSPVTSETVKGYFRKPRRKKA